MPEPMRRFADTPAEQFSAAMLAQEENSLAARISTDGTEIGLFLGGQLVLQLDAAEARALGNALVETAGRLERGEFRPKEDKPHA